MRMTERILVTGGAGYVGSHACKALAAGYEHHDPETHLIPLAIAAAQGRIEAVQVYGTAYDTPDGSAIRDYIHAPALVASPALAQSALGWRARRSNLRRIVETAWRWHERRRDSGIGGYPTPAFDGAQRRQTAGDKRRQKKSQ
jgi:UDP-arabinose 4-epimerase